ncbi:hypothetical protein L0F63_003599 [Massospora cicadina]|nr:hypothetical protein L0F63_003599 [Massospora cicadina]
MPCMSSPDNINLTALSSRSEANPALTPTDNAQQSHVDAGSERAYCDSNIAMYIPSVARGSPEPTLRSLRYAPTDFSTQPSLAFPPASAPEPAVPQHLSQPGNADTRPTASDSISVHATQHFSRTSKLLLIVSVSASLIQIITCVIVLCLYWNQTCDSPLRIYILLYVARLFVSVPITVLYYLKPPRRNRRTPFSMWIDRARSVMDSRTGHRGYFVITIPVFFCGAVIFCLPCVLVVMRVLRVGEATGVGASSELISKLPILKSDKHLSIKNRPAEVGPDFTPTSAYSLNAEPRDSSRPVSVASPKRSIFRSLFMSGRKANAASSNFYRPKPLPILQLEEEADAVCAICITEYEDSDEICKMFCNHHYHVDCVDEWLRQNRTCPLCKRDITGLADPPPPEDDF